MPSSPGTKHTHGIQTYEQAGKGFQAKTLNEIKNADLKIFGKPFNQFYFQYH